MNQSINYLKKYFSVFLCLYIFSISLIFAMEEQNNARSDQCIKNEANEAFRIVMNTMSEEFSLNLATLQKNLKSNKNILPKKKGLTEIEKALKNGADPNSNIGDRTALMIAFERKQKPLFDLLLSYSADVNMANQNGWTILHIMADKTLDDDNDGRQMLQDVLRRGADINAMLPDGKFPLCMAVEKGNNVFIDILASLKNIKADFDKKKNDRYASLAFAILNNKRDDFEIIKKLCEMGASLVNVTYDNANAFHLAATESKSCIEALITHARFDFYNQMQNDLTERKVITIFWAFDKIFPLCPKEVIFYILEKLTLLDKSYFFYKKLCKKLYENNHKSFLIAQVNNRVKKIREILDLPKKNGQTALQLLQDNNFVEQHYKDEVKPLLDGTKLENDFSIFSDATSTLEENLATEMYKNCIRLLTEEN